MIIARSPLRITLGGGGTDLPSYSRLHGGLVIAGAIDKYVTIMLHDTFQRELILKYSKLERVGCVEEIEHPILREALKMSGISEPSLEIASMADIPAGTGLGSSGSFTTALLKALAAYRGEPVSRQDLAERACALEIDRLGEPVGKQDPYIAAYGGLQVFRFHPDGGVEARPLAVKQSARYELEDNLLLFYTGKTRSASTILRDQDERSRNGDPVVTANLHAIKRLGELSLEALESGELERFGRLMDEHWRVKRERASLISDPSIDDCYDEALRSGALGGKLVGAGGAGFLMFYAEKKTALRKAMTERGLREVRFRFDREGTKEWVRL